MAFNREPLLYNNGRWDHIASETELKQAMTGKVAICEASTIGLTFIINHARMTIVRCGSLGGDQRDIEGGWVYTNFFSMERDWREILSVAGAMS